MAGWESLDRGQVFKTARKYLGIMAVKDLKRLLAIADWKRRENIDDEV